jgi:hypothetical protein
MDHEPIWLTPEQPVPDEERHMTQSPTLILDVARNPSGFHVLTALSGGLKFNSGDYTMEILEGIKD